MSRARQNSVASSEQTARLERIVERFEDAWERGERPHIADFAARDATDRLSTVVELVHVELELRVKEGEPARVEEYLEQFPELARDRTVVLELICAEFALRQRREPRVTTAEYVDRFPQYRQELESLLKGPIHPRQRSKVRLNCPHCRNPIAVVVNGSDEVVCPSCGSTFQLAADRTLSWEPTKLPHLGKFELVRSVGRGAFGTVYRARDTELDRVVAVKVPRSGRLATQEDEDRFMREARAVAKLRHPGIVSVFEVGRADAFPYIVTEYVEGVTLRDALSARRFTFRDTAELIVQVAEILHHAHTQGVVHRDLKPSNIMLEHVGGATAMARDEARSPTTKSEASTLVGAEDESPAAAIASPRYRPRLMDFGLAKRDAGEVTMTVEGQILGTPAYMSPEQARGEGHRADSRTDVYSLGVILYEMLTGELPFRGTAQMLMHQVIHDDAPSPCKLNHRIPRDLETVTLKCLAKELGRRYRTAGDLAADLNRWLAGEPIRARPVGRVERIWRWTRRNALVASLSSGFVLAVIAALVGVTWQWRRAERHRKIAEENFDTAQKTVNDYFTLVSDNELLNVPGMQPVRDELLGRALQYHKAFQQQHEGDPAFEVAVAASYFRVTQVQAEIGSFAQTFFSFVEGVTRLEKALEKNPPPEETKRWLGAGIYHGRLRTPLEDWARPLDSVPSEPQPVVVFNLEKAITLWQRLIDQQPTVAGFKNDLAGLHNFTGTLRREWGEYDLAIQSLERARDIWVELHREHPRDANFALDLATAYGVISGVRWQQNRFTEALEAQEKSLEVLTQLVGSQPKPEPSFVADLAGCQYTVGRIRQSLYEPDEAMKLFTLARDGLNELNALYPTIPIHQRDLATVCSSLGRLQHERKQPTDALDSLRRAVELHRQLRPTKPRELYNLASELALCAQLVAGDTTERQDYVNQAVATLRKAVSAGYKDVNKLETDPDLAAIRDHAGYKELIEQMKDAVLPPIING